VSATDAGGVSAAPSGGLNARSAGSEGAPELRSELPGGATVLFTDRFHGSFALPPGSDPSVAAEQRERVQRLTGATALARGRQVHGSTVARLTSREGLEGGASPTDLEADGQSTSLAGLAVMVVSADCLPVAVAGTNAVAMLHCGWRGLAAGVLEEGVAAVRGLAGPGPLTALIGPGAGACCYEVGPEVHEALGVLREDTRIDLARVARSRLVAAGVADVRTVELCTICDERFYSHRREGARAGRQAGIAWLS
jgi:YfiH family protein